MIHLSEEQSAALISHEVAYEAVRAALIAATDPASKSFPVVLGHASDPQNRFTIKSATGPELTGLKVGSYFPTNDLAGLPRHDSMILLFDQSRGRIGAIIEGGRVNAYRTAAADAVATDVLAREDASVLTVIGTGHQAAFEASAIARIRSIEKVLVVGRNADRAEAFSGGLQKKGMAAEVCDAETACRSADIIVTATTANAPLFHAEWVKPGTHISSMGSDATGKKELPTELYPNASLFCDLPSQSRSIGEFQDVPDTFGLTAIGDVLTGEKPGRQSEDEITVFDSSGISLQDLFIAEALIKLASQAR